MALEKSNKKKKHRILRRLGRVCLTILMLFVVLVLVIRSPWGQGLIVSKVTNYVAEKVGTKVEIDRLFLTFSGNLSLEGLYLEDKQGDTLVYSKALEADVGLSQLIFGNAFILEYLEWEGLKANVTRQEGSEDFNFTFLVDAFVAQDSAPAPGVSSEPMGISVGSISLKDFDIIYDDAFMGIDSKLRLGRLYAEANTIDLEGMRFQLDDLELSDTEAVYQQTKPFPETEDSTETALPFVRVDNFKIEKVKANYSSVPDSLTADVSIGNFLLELPKADLAKNDFEIDLLALKNSDISLKMPAQREPAADSVALTSSGFVWPEFLVQVGEIDMENNNIAYTTGSNRPEAGKFNPKAVAISNFILRAKNIEYRHKLANLELQQLSFWEKSGFNLRDFAFDARLEDDNAALSGLKIRTDNSSVSGEIALKYTSVDALIETPENVKIQLNIPNLNLALPDAYVFQPNLANNEYVKTAATKTVTGSLEANGTLASIQIPNLNIDWGENTSLEAQGLLNNVMNPDSLSFDFSTIRAISAKKDVLQFISEDSLGISVPESILVAASAKGSFDDIEADATLKIPEGSLQLTGNYVNRQNIAFNGILKVDSLRLDKLLKNEQLGGVSFTMEAKGSGNGLNTLNASLKSDFTQLTFKEYDFSNLFLEGDIVNGKGDIDLNFKDENLNFTTNTQVNLDAINSKIDFDLQLIGADLYALGITKEQIKAGVRMSANFEGSADDFSFDALFSEGIAVYDNKQYQMGTIDLKTHIGQTITEASIESDFLNGGFTSNASPDKITAALQRQFKGYFSNEEINDTLTGPPVTLAIDMALTPVPILTEVFFRGIERLDSVNIGAKFDAVTKNLDAKVYMPELLYNGIGIDSLEVSVNGNATDLNFTAGFSALLADPVNVQKTYFKGNLKNRELLLDFNSYDGQEKLVHIASELVLAKDTINLHINPLELTFNKKEWSIPQDNQISIGDKLLNFKNINLSRNAQELTISNNISDIEEQHIGVTFDNFRLQTFLSLLNPDEELASGLVKGRLVVENPFEASGLVADFNIDKLVVMRNALGDLSLDAASKGKGNYDFNLALKNGGIDLDLTGDYAASETGAELNLDLDLNKVDLKVIEGLSEGAIKEANGYISGNVKVTGTTTEPEYEGKLDFNQVVFNVATLNSVFKIENETLNVNNSGLYLDTFEITDTNNNGFIIDGSILTKELINPSFDLNLTANAFQALNSTVEDNELFYGVASFDVDITVEGNLNLPKVEGKLKVRKITDITYVVPESQLDVEERDGVVIFVNREDPDAILTRNDQEEAPAFFKGMDAQVILEIANDAVFHVIIDEKTGDNLEISGDAALSLNVEPSGRINLSGRYELNSGHYETSLYNLVKRRFEINPGSTITWQGDPTDAALDVTAVYNVETSAAPLMSTVTSGEAAGVAGQYRQVLPFIVYLYVKGELLQPKLSFGMDMPEEEQGALGGAVYSQVQQLNEQEGELNKQVFSLLALNRFFPDSGSDGSSGGTAAIARDNVNKVLSGQLNAFSDKVFGNSGIDLNFDLDSFTDYQGDSPQDRTQLNINAQKKLLDDRLIVTAGSAVDVEGSASQSEAETPLIGNVSLEYLLTENGRYRLRGFRKNEYTNVIDGQLIVTGAAFIFNREFNKFSELFNPIKENDLEKEDDEDGDKKEKNKKIHDGKESEGEE